MLFRPQYDVFRILGLAAKYLTMPYNGGTAADDPKMEKAGRRLVSGPLNLADVERLLSGSLPAGWTDSN
jgi:hypothetical protein